MIMDYLLLLPAGGREVTWMAAGQPAMSIWTAAAASGELAIGEDEQTNSNVWAARNEEARATTQVLTLRIIVYYKQ
jgi:hypothetical protein